MAPAVVVLLVVACIFAQGAVIFRVLEPVGVNDTFVVAGSTLDGTSTVEFCDGHGACANATLLSAASQTVRAVMPDSLDPRSTVSASLLDTAGKVVATVGAVNVPVVSWWQGSGASPSHGGPGALLGDRLRLFGRNFAFQEGRCLPFTRQSSPVSPVVRAHAVDLTSGTSVPLRVTFASCYRVDVIIPDGPEIHGDGRVYQIRLANGLEIGPGLSPSGDTAVITNITFGRAAWPSAIFRVNFTGVSDPSPGCNSISQCLATAGAAGGGTVVIPAGTWAVCESWLFPDKVESRPESARVRSSEYQHCSLSRALPFSPLGCSCRCREGGDHRLVACMVRHSGIFQPRNPKHQWWASHCFWCPRGSMAHV